MDYVIMEAKKLSKKVIQYAIILAFMLLFQFLPPMGPVTPIGMKILGIFIGCIIGWAFGEQTWPSLLAVFLLGMMEGSSVPGTFAAAMGNGTVHMVLLCLVICAALSSCGLIDYLCKKILSTRFARKGPWALMTAFWIAGALSCGLTNGTVVIVILLWNIFYELVDRLNLEKDSPYVAVGIIGIAITCYLGGNIMPYSSFVQICWGVMAAADPNATINPNSYILFQLILNAVLIPVLALFCKFVLRIKADYDVPANLFSKEDLKMTQKLRTMIIYLVILILMLILPNFMPGTPVAKFLNQMSLVGAFVIIIVALAITPDGEGGRMIDIGKAFTQVPYGLLFVVATALTMAGQLTNEATGIPVLLNNVLAPITKIGSPYMIVAVMVFVSVILTNVVNNIVCATIMIPVSVILMQNAGIHPAVLIALLCTTLQQGIVVPSGSVFGAMLHGIDGYITSKSVYKFGIILELFLGLVIGLGGTALAQLIF